MKSLVSYSLFWHGFSFIYVKGGKEEKEGKSESLEESGALSGLPKESRDWEEGSLTSEETDCWDSLCWPS